jgi:hypothetical protein
MEKTHTESDSNDKVTLYTGIAGERGTGDMWSSNPLVAQSAGSGDYNAQCTELDLNNEGAPRGTDGAMRLVR